jgi:DHA2 family multidrug resistance protein
MELDAASRRLVVAGTMLAVSLYTIDTTILNVALPHIQGSLQATQDQVLWVLTSYMVTSAVMTPLAGYLALRFGERPVLLASVAGFTLMSMLCGIATALPELVLFRALQGVAGAALIPISMTALIGAYPRSQSARAINLWAGGVMLGPVIGPSLGGWITEYANWRWVFYINVPVGAFAWMALAAAMPRTAQSPNRPFDLRGYLMLALSLLSLQLALDRGSDRGWFDSTEILIECGLGAVLLYMFIVHSTTTRNPFFEPRIFKDRNLIAALLMSVFIYPQMIVPSALLPSFMQHAQNFSVMDTGFVMAPRGAGMALAMFICGKLVTRMNGKLLMVAGLLIIMTTCWSLSGLTPDFSETRLIVLTILQGFGMGLTWSPSNAMAFNTLPNELRTEATVVMTLARAVGGAVILSLVGVLVTHSTAANHSRLVEMFTPFSTATLAAGASVEQSRALLDSEILRQALILAYDNAFYVMGILCLVAIAIVPAFKFVPPANQPTGTKSGIDAAPVSSGH